WAPESSRESVVFAGGCFWGVQSVFEHVRGVVAATAGYAGGQASTAQYETVSTGTTGHAESVHVVFDPSQVSFGELLEVYFSVAHNPTELNFQGPDVGSQYRSEIFYTRPEQARIAKAYILQLEAAHDYSRPIVTTLAPLPGFYPAEAYHQDYAPITPTTSTSASTTPPSWSRCKKSGRSTSAPAPPPRAKLSACASSSSATTPTTPPSAPARPRASSRLRSSASATTASSCTAPTSAAVPAPSAFALPFLLGWRAAPSAARGASAAPSTSWMPPPPKPPGSLSFLAQPWSRAPMASSPSTIRRSSTTTAPACSISPGGVAPGTPLHA